MIEFRVSFNECSSYFIQIQYQDESDQNVKKYSEPSYINVQPNLKVGKLNNEVINLNSIRMITVVSRCLGKVDRWPKVFTNIHELGYNAIHFTPF